MTKHIFTIVLDNVLPLWINNTSWKVSTVEIIPVHISHIRTEYGEIRISAYSVRMQKIRTRITPNTDTLSTILNKIFGTK